MVFDHRVDLDDLATDRGLQVGDCFDGFDFAKGLSGFHEPAYFGQVAVHEVSLVSVAKFVDGKVGDANDDGVPVNLGPFVGGGVASVVGSHDEFSWNYRLRE